MMMDMGRPEAWMMALLVSVMSEMTPSVSISRMKYCCYRGRWDLHSLNSHRNNFKSALCGISCTYLLYGTCMATVADLGGKVAGSLLCKPSNVLNDRGKVGGPPELHRAQGCVVGLHHSLDTCTEGVLWVAVQSKLVGHL